jgi:hypothetical protein
MSRFLRKTEVENKADGFRQKLKITELKELLVKHGLAQTGKKDDLVKRLVENNISPDAEEELEDLVSSVRVWHMCRSHGAATDSQVEPPADTTGESYSAAPAAPAAPSGGESVSHLALRHNSVLIPSFSPRLKIHQYQSHPLRPN